MNVVTYEAVKAELDNIENNRPASRNIDWLCRAIEWMYRWRRITDDQLIELTSQAAYISDHMTN